MTHDQGFAWGCRWAIHNLPIIALVFALAFVSMSFIGYCWEQLERFMQ